MEVQLQELIEQIKNDGVAAAETEAKNIIAVAKAEAEKIVSEAQAKADKIIVDAKRENELLVKSSEDAIRRAGRNILISFRESVARELKSITAENVATVYSSDEFAKLISSVVEGWVNKPDVEDVEVILNTEDIKKLEGILFADLKQKMINGVTLKANDNFDGGFRITLNDDTAYYDYSVEAVVEMLSNYLSPRVTELLKEA